jgi:hypothetical protein
MPATFPSHPGFVLPLKAWRPRWFDGVALAVGSASPDIAYLLDGSGWPVWPLSHEPLGLVVWCLPVTLAVAWLLRQAAPVVAAHLPPAGLGLRDYGALGRNPHRWYVTAWSAGLGGASHLVADLLEAREPESEAGLHLLGGLVFLLVLRHVGRHGLIRKWHGPAPAVPRRPRLFWGVATVVAVAGALAAPYLPAAGLIHTTGVRLLAALVGALMVAAACTACAGRIHAAGWIS